MTGNDFVKFFLRTPLCAFMGNTMLITVTGYKTGKKYSVPVGFYRDGREACLWVMTSRERTWWHNVRNGANVSVLLKGKTVNAFAEAELDEKVVVSHLFDYVHCVPMAATPLGIRMEANTPNRQDVMRAAKDKLFVKVRPER